MNNLSICRDGKSIVLTDEEMLEAYQILREYLLEQEFLLRYSDSDAITELSKDLQLDNSERGILEDILLLSDSFFMHSVADEMARLLDAETDEDCYSDMLYCILKEHLRYYFNAYRS